MGPTDRSPITASGVRILAELASLDLPEDRLAKMVASLREVLAGQDTLADLDLAETEPELGFRAHWE